MGNCGLLQFPLTLVLTALLNHFRIFLSSSRNDSFSFHYQTRVPIFDSNAHFLLLISSPNNV